MIFNSAIFIFYDIFYPDLFFCSKNYVLLFLVISFIWDFVPDNHFNCR